MPAVNNPAWMYYLAAMAGCALLCVLLAPLARKLGWMDTPTARKVHAVPTPLVGGVAIFISLFSLLLAAPQTDLLNWPPLALLLAGAIVLITGLVDDRWPLSATVRFLSQGLACLVMVFMGGVMLKDFGRLFWHGVLNLGYLAIPITVFGRWG